MSLALLMFVVAFFEEKNVFHFKFQNGSDNSPAVSLLGDKRSIKLLNYSSNEIKMSEVYPREKYRLKSVM